MPAKVEEMSGLSRRQFLRVSGIGLAGITPLLASYNYAHAGVPPLSVGGTTLDAAAIPLGQSGYQRLDAGPGWPVVARTELASAGNKRQDRRVDLASFVQLTDVHILDAQSPARVEFLHPVFSSAFRPQETLSAHGLIALVERINNLRSGPHTRRPFDVVITTGDNTDNQEILELDWMMRIMNGGRVSPNSGGPYYEGVQNSGSAMYWNPESDMNDSYKRAGFPHIPGFLGAALRDIDSPGLNTPWYCVFGNHDNAMQGTVPVQGEFLHDLYTGSTKYEAPPASSDVQLLDQALKKTPHRYGSALRTLAPVRSVTPDERRRPVTPREFIGMHLKSSNTGPGPRGHGFVPGADESGQGYYDFSIAPGVVGISLDSTNRAGLVDGSLGWDQYRWLEATLRRGSSRYFDAGRATRHDVTDLWFVVFSHHTSQTMDNLLPDPEVPSEPRVPGSAVIELLHNYPNVLAWVNGHTHRNAITPHPGSTPEQSFWEITTASHIDYPQLGRIIELVDNTDGTVSIFTTLFEADSPYAVPYGNTSLTSLASLYRELAFNDLHAEATRLGSLLDRNTELLCRGRV